MPEPSEFEEKEFESKLVFSLGTSGEFWTPGQVLEHRCGTEIAVAATREVFRVLGQPWHSGIRLDDPRWWRLITKGWARAGTPPPDFRANAFLQVKRSMRYKKVVTRLRAMGFTTPGWCFDVTPQQQAVMEGLETALANDAVVTYAAPVFDTRADLFRHSRAGTLLSNTTFPTASALQGHGRWAYASGGAVGVALSEPKSVEGDTLPDRIVKLRLWSSSRTVGSDISTFVQQLTSLLKALQVTASKIPDGHESLRDLFTHMTESAGAELSDGIAQAYARVVVGTAVLGLRWMAVDATRTETQ